MKADFRATCAKHGVDPITGAVGTQLTAAAFRQSSFGRALAAAEQTKATHHERMRKLVYSRQMTKLYIPKCDGSNFWVYLFGDDHGGIDWDKVELRASRGWWKEKELWRASSSRFISSSPAFIVKLHGDAPPQPELGAFGELFTQAKEIEDQIKNQQTASIPVLISTDDVLRMMIHEIYMEVRGALPLKQLHAKQAAAEEAAKAARKAKPNGKLTLSSPLTTSQLYNYL